MKTGISNHNRAWLRSFSLLALSFGLSAPLAVCADPAPALPGDTPRAEALPDTAPIPAHVKRKILEHMEQSNLERLKGWPGIIFYCPVEEAKNPVLKTLCTEINGEIGALLAASNIKFQIAKNAFDLHFLPHMTGRLLLVVDLTATDPSAQPSAVYAKVVALAHYAHAVNWSSELNPVLDAGDGRSPLEVPQHVDATLWESQIIAAGPGDQESLLGTVRKGIEDMLKAFLAEFDKINRPAAK